MQGDIQFETFHLIVGGWRPWHRSAEMRLSGPPAQHRLRVRLMYALIPSHRLGFGADGAARQFRTIVQMVA
jgi:hypothetical protein